MPEEEKKEEKKEAEVSKLLEEGEVSIDKLLKIMIARKLISGGKDISKYLLASKLLE